MLCDQARREPQRGPGKHSREALKHFHGTLLGRKFLIFFSIWYILAYYIFLADAAFPPNVANVAGTGVAYPLPHPLDGPVCDLCFQIINDTVSITRM